MFGPEIHPPLTHDLSGCFELAAADQLRRIVEQQLLLETEGIDRAQLRRRNRLGRQAELCLDRVG